MARSHIGVAFMLLGLLSASAAAAGSRAKAAPASAAAAPAAAAASAAPAPEAPAAPAPSPPGAAPSPSAAAQKTPASVQLEPPPAGAKADQIAEYAAQLFKQQRFSEAGDALQLAYQREPRPIFLFNVGQTFRKAGRYADAIAAYKRFAQAAPDHPLVSEARGYENTLVVLVEQQERTSQIELSLVDKQAEAERVRQNLMVQQRKTEEAQHALAAEKAKQKKIYSRPWFWGVVGGAAAVVVIVGISLGVTGATYVTNGGTLKFTAP